MGTVTILSNDAENQDSLSNNTKHYGLKKNYHKPADTQDLTVPKNRRTQGEVSHNPGNMGVTIDWTQKLHQLTFEKPSDKG